MPSLSDPTIGGGMHTKQQIVISGVGGQGVLFVTRILADAAIAMGLPVLTSETHGMAQRGGTVVSHLKVGGFQSPLIRPGQADGLLCLKAENLAAHGPFLKPGAWAVINANTPVPAQADIRARTVDADAIAETIKNPRAVNLIVLGEALSQNPIASPPDSGRDGLFCTFEEVRAVLNTRLTDKKEMLAAALGALEASAQDIPEKDASL